MHVPMPRSPGPAYAILHDHALTHPSGGETPRDVASDDLAAFLDNMFHGAALTAYVEQARSQQSWPCPEATRRRAYSLYEAELAAKPANRRARHDDQAATVDWQ